VLVSLLDSLDDETRDLLHFDEKELKALMPSEFKPSETKEVDPGSFEFDHKCPKCGFEFDG
jgi:hypothetical protein